MSPRRMRTAQGGFSLIEGLIALAIFSLGMLGMANLQANLVQMQSNAALRAEAAFFAERIIGHAIADPGNAACYALAEPCGSTIAQSAAENWLAQVQAAIPGADELAPRVTYTPADGRFAVLIEWRHPGDDTTRNVSFETLVR